VDELGHETSPFGGRYDLCLNSARSGRPRFIAEFSGSSGVGIDLAQIAQAIACEEILRLGGIIAATKLDVPQSSLAKLK
jgi:hypothetical protein